MGMDLTTAEGCNMVVDAVDVDIGHSRRVRLCGRRALIKQNSV